MIGKAYSRMADDGVRVYAAKQLVTPNTLLVYVSFHGFDGTCSQDVELQSPEYFRAKLAQYA